MLPLKKYRYKAEPDAVVSALQFTQPNPALAKEVIAEVKSYYPELTFEYVNDYCQRMVSGKRHRVRFFSLFENSWLIFEEGIKPYTMGPNDFDARLERVRDKDLKLPTLPESLRWYTKIPNDFGRPMLQLQIKMVIDGPDGKEHTSWQPIQSMRIDDTRDYTNAIEKAEQMFRNFNNLSNESFQTSLAGRIQMANVVAFVNAGQPE